MRSRFLLLLIGSSLLAADKPDYQRLAALARSRSPELGEALANAFGADLAKGRAYASYLGDFVFAVESGPAPSIVIDESAPVPMQRAGDSNRWFRLAALETGRTHNVSYEAGGKAFAGRTDIPAFGPDSYPRPGVPRGKLSEKMVHSSKIYGGMNSDYWVYVPARYDPATPAALMVWQDGEVLVPREEPSRAQIVFDNLTHEQKIPIIIHVLISPGLIGSRTLRSVEYDTVDDTYARFLRDEILAEVAAKYNLRKDGYSRAIAGDSSGGICSFNAAWFQPDQFSRVLSRIGSFTSIQWQRGQLDGGNIYPFLIRKEARRNLRVWLQDGSGDLENQHGSWPAQNIAMANSLKLRGYDFRFRFGNGTHSRNGGHAELPEEMIWLWRGYDPSKTEQNYEQDPAEAQKPVYRVKALARE